MTDNPDLVARLSPELHDPLAAWSFNVMLECSGRAEKDCEVMMGGAFLDLRDLKRILDWAAVAADQIEALRVQVMALQDRAGRSERREEPPQTCWRLKSHLTGLKRFMPDEIVRRCADKGLGWVKHYEPACSECPRLAAYRSAFPGEG